MPYTSREIAQAEEIRHLREDLATRINNYNAVVEALDAVANLKHLGDPDAVCIGLSNISDKIDAALLAARRKG
jgi:hypothetical protein